MEYSLGPMSGTVPVNMKDIQKSLKSDSVYPFSYRFVSQIHLSSMYAFKKNDLPSFLSIFG